MVRDELTSGLPPQVTRPESAIVWRLFLGLLVAVSGIGGVGISAADAGAEDTGEFEFEQDAYQVDPPESVAIELDTTSGGFYRFVVESPGDSFHVELVVGVSEDRASGENPTLVVDTGRVNSTDPEAYLSVLNGRLHRITVHENAVDGDELPGGRYDVRAFNQGNMASATLDVSPSVWFDSGTALNRSAIERTPNRTISGRSDLQAGERIQIRVESTGEQAFRLEEEAVVGTDGQFETTIDLSPVPAGTNFDIVARHDDVTRTRQRIRLLDDLPAPTNGMQADEGIVFAFEGEQITLKAGPNQTISGETTLEEGAVMTIILRSPVSHLLVTTTTVDEYGTFRVTVDLGHLEPRDGVVVSAIAEGGAGGAAPVTVVDPGAFGATESVTELQLGQSSVTGERAGPARNVAAGITAIVVGALLAIVGSGMILGGFRFREL